MNDSPYWELDKLIFEYEQFKGLLNSNNLFIQNYPKILVMSIASRFEVLIKKRIKDFCVSPILPLQSKYPLIYELTLDPKKTVDEIAYTKFRTFDRKAGIEDLSATEFYLLFGGQAFIADLKKIHQHELTNQKNEITKKINHLSTLTEHEVHYVNALEKKDQLDLCNFGVSERAFLSLKFRRNRVAHDYINGISDTFNDIRNFYYDALLYVIALETTLTNLTTPLEN